MTAKVSKKNSFSTLSYQVLWLGSGIRPPRTIPLGPGKPVFSNSCKGGINEIIINGSNGLACDFTNKEDFQNGLHEFLGTKFDESKIVELTSSRYSIETIIKKYINFFS